MSARDSSDDESLDARPEGGVEKKSTHAEHELSEEDLPAISSMPHRSFGMTATPRDRPIFRQSTTLRYQGLPADTRAAAARLASDRSLTPPATSVGWSSP